MSSPLLKVSPRIFASVLKENPPHAPAPQPRWMIVDDNEDARTSMLLAIRRMTIAALDSFPSPHAALSAFAAAPNVYELVITDFEMPGMSGVELCRAIHALAPSLKMIVVTGSAELSEQAAVRHGFSALLRKPFSAGLLKNTIEAVLPSSKKT